MPSLKKKTETCLHVPPLMLSSSSIACLLASLDDKGLFSSANTLQIADAVGRVLQYCSKASYHPLVRREPHRARQESRGAQRDSHSA